MPSHQEKGNKNIYNLFRTKSAVWKYSGFWRRDGQQTKYMPFAKNASRDKILRKQDKLDISLGSHLGKLIAFTAGILSALFLTMLG